MNITDIITSGLLAENKIHDRIIGIYWPSECSCKVNNKIIGNCLRQIYWKIYGASITNPTKVSTIRILKLGSIIEENEIDIAKKCSNLYVADHIPFKMDIEGITLSGEIDAIYQQEDTCIGIEYKSGHGYYFTSRIFGSSKNPPLPKLKDIMQVMLYLLYCKDHQYNNKSIQDFKLIYIDRGTGLSKEFNISLNNKYPIIDNQEYDDFSTDDIIARFVQLDKYVKKKIIPPVDFHNYYSKNQIKKMADARMISKIQHKKWDDNGYGLDWECEYCPYLNRCMTKEGIR